MAWVCFVGELLVDLVAEEAATPLAKCSSFRRRLGGSCANVARLLHALGTETKLYAAVGQDGFGDFLVDGVFEAGQKTTGIKRIENVPTTAIVISRTPETPTYIPYLAAHAELRPEDVPEDAIRGASILHCNAFSLARTPLQRAILRAVDRANDLGVPISFDPNYRRDVWPDRDLAMALVLSITAGATWMKPSLDDAIALFGKAEPEELASRYKELGAKNVILTMGADGCLVVTDDGVTHVPAKGSLRSATGAGDAFWSIFMHNVLGGAASTVEAAQKASAGVADLLEKYGYG